jgi:molecular chaperone DnaJ
MANRTPREILGVAPEASRDEIRERYRARARELHPDRSGAASSAAMAELNDAYRTLMAGGNTPPRPSSTPSATSYPIPNPPIDVPARFPWRFVGGIAVVGIVGVLVSAAVAGPAIDQQPDGVIQSGSCVSLDDAGFAREVACVDPATDLVVRDLVPSEAVCADGTLGNLDRLGLGRVCLTGK